MAQLCGKNYYFTREHDNKYFSFVDFGSHNRIGLYESGNNKSSKPDGPNADWQNIGQKMGFGQTVGWEMDS